jgi:hypothetical protein
MSILSMIVTLQQNVAVLDENSDVIIPNTIPSGPDYHGYYIRCKSKSDLCLFHLMLLDGSLPIGLGTSIL